MRAALRLRQVPDGWLLAHDLRAAHVPPVQRLAQHQVAAHRRWGVSAGLIVMAFSGELLVSPGCAVDRCGRMVVLPELHRVPLHKGQPVAAALTARGDGPQGRVALREPGQLHDLDVPLARIDGTGEVHGGDGDRQWLRRPGPILNLGGRIGRGAPVTGTASCWTASVDLADLQLSRKPAVVATLADPAPTAAQSTTVSVTTLTESGFDIVVRHTVSIWENAPSGSVGAAPLALNWLAVLPADRPDFPPLEDW